MQNKRTILAIAIFVLFIVVWFAGKFYLFPPRETPPISGPAQVAKEHVDTNTVVGLAVGSGIKFEQVESETVLGLGAGPGIKAARAEYSRSLLALGAGPFVTVAKAAERKKPPPVVVTPPQKVTRRIALGDKDPQSKYHLYAVLDARGAAVRMVLLNKFQAVGDDGQPQWEDAEHKVRKLLVLVPEDKEGALSYPLYHFDPGTANTDTSGLWPLPTLGNIEWTVVSPKEGSEVDAGPEQAVVFQAKIPGVVIEKKYTLKEGEYHLGLEVRMYKDKEHAGDKSDLWFRYQMAGALGLPVEGKWYTSTFRNALIAQVDKSSNTVYTRDLQDLRTISGKDGGDEVLRAEGRFIRYAAVAIQYFTSAIVVDDNQEKDKRDFLSRVRPTLETAAVKGTVKEVTAGGSSFKLTVGDKDQTFHVDDDVLRMLVPPPNVPLGVVYRTDSRHRAIVLKLYVGSEASKMQPLFETDITVRVATEPINLKDATDEQHAVVHKYLLYNGPTKPMLLAQMKEPGTVSDELVRRYSDNLNLNTLVDWHSPGWFGETAYTVTFGGWTWLLVHTTNLMHLILHFFSWIGLPPALCIILLTVLVRGMMFPISRKAAMTNIKMQELQPEIKKLKEKHKDDPQALNMAVWQLQRKSGVNPLSTCWLMFLQMPIFMGLYFALQESIHFRAAAFWPTWIHNLAAPDMLWDWGQSIPFISAPDSYGSFIYLGPYLNILPVIAVTLMIFQQKYTMPPPTDEQQEMQQKMMKYMMVFMGLMFYKVPSGLVLYFIASSIWGFCERKLLPKKKPATTTGEPAKENFLQTLLSRPAAPKDGQTAITATPPATTTNGSPKADGKGRNRAKQGKAKRKSERNARAEAIQTAAENGSVFQRLRNWWRQRRERMNDWWEKLREEAQKKNR